MIVEPRKHFVCHLCVHLVIIGYDSTAVLLHVDSSIFVGITQ